MTMRYIIMLVRENGEVYFWNVNEQAFLRVLTMGCINPTEEHANAEINSPRFAASHARLGGNITIVPTNL